MTTHPLHKTQARERPGTFPERATRPARHARATPLRQLAGWLRPHRDGQLWRDGQGGGGSRPETEASPVVLRDGSRVLVRPVRSTDALLLADRFARLSERSRRMRFLGKKESCPRPSCVTTPTWTTTTTRRSSRWTLPSGRGVGVARYVRDADDPQAAEIALTVADEWQGRGLGTELLARLSHRARQEGVCRFTGVVSCDNVPMGMLMRSVGAVETDRSFGTVEYEIALVRAGEYSLDWWFRCVDDGSVFTWQ